MSRQTGKLVRLGFELNCVRVPLDKLHATKELPPTLRSSVKYKKIRASINAIGVVEPIAVCPRPEAPGEFQVLDGHLRMAALRELGKKDVNCLISTDDEAFTYNRRVSRLPVVQEHRMIVRAFEGGASVERLAAALDISPDSIRNRFRMLDGICDEAVRLLADKPTGRTLFLTLKKMTAFRQIDVARTMIGLDNYSIKLAEAMLQATPADQLAPDVKLKVQRSGATETVQRLHRELAAVQADSKQLNETYAETVLQLAIVKSYVEGILKNARVVRWLARFNRDYLEQLQLVADIKKL